MLENRLPYTAKNSHIVKLCLIVEVYKNFKKYVLKGFFSFIRLLAKVILNWKNQISKNGKIAFSTAHTL